MDYLGEQKSRMKGFKIVFLIIMLQNFYLTNFVLADAQSRSSQESNKITEDVCDATTEDKNELISGWYLWEPYQFYKVTPNVYKLTGMDIELLKAIAAKVGVGIKYSEVPWDVHQADLKVGKRDIASGATYSEERAKFAHFSVPYRFEENSLFVLKNSDKKINFSSIPEYIAQLRLQNFRLGVIKGFIYSDPQINEFIKDEENSDIIFKYDNDTESLQALLDDKIDGFMSDRITGAAVSFNALVSYKINEIPLKIKTPIHLMFSKKTIPLDLVDKFNNEIKKLITSQEYKKIVKIYLYPVLLMETIDTQWFYILGIIGTIAFAISSIAIAASENLTLFGTFVLAMLPSVGGGIMRDVILNRDPVGIILTPSYIYYILIVVLIGFSTIRLLEYYNDRADEDSSLKKLWDNLLIIGDALGQATFIVIGVSVAVMAQIEPIMLWGPFFAFLSSRGGGILRDLMRKDKVIGYISEEISSEISVLWGFIFSLFLDINAYSPDPDKIKYMVIAVTIGALITRLLVHYLKIPNIRFR